MIEIKDIRIGNSLKEAYGDAVLGCIRCTVKTGETPADLLAEIEKECADMQEKMEVPNIQNRPHIAETRACYKAIGKDFRRYRNSAEAMHRRVLQGKGLYRINNVVDSMNLFSIRTGYSVGAYNAEKLEGKVEWMISPEGTHYDGIGGKEGLNVEFLPVLSDDNGPFGNPTSDNVRAMITEETKELLLCIYGFGGEEAMKAEIGEAEELLKKYCDAKIKEVKVLA